MTSVYLADITVRHQVYLERLKAGEAKDAQALLYALNRAIADAMGKLGSADLSSLSRAALESFIAELQATQRSIIQSTMDTFQTRLKALAAYETQFEAAAIVTVAPAAVVTALTGIEAYKAALARPLAVDGGLLQPFIDKLSESEVLSLTNIIRRGYVENWATSQIMKAVQGTKKARYTDGLIAKVGRANEAIVRTSIQHVASTARFETWNANADIITGYRWISVLDGHTTAQCRSLDGQVFKLGEGPVPPIHINCRSTTVAQLDDRFDVLSKGATRASADGPVASKTTYYTWLKRQPAAFQDSVLGPIRGKLLRNGGLSSAEFAALQLDKNFRPLTLDEMKALQPHAFELAGIN